jgi:glycosyltransferase involved in cell wall biosynthesis
VPAVFFMRSGHFMNEVRSSGWWALCSRLLLKIPFRIGVQGGNWIDFYRGLGVTNERIVLVRNWLPESVEIVNEPKTVRFNHLVHFIFVGWLVREKGICELLEAIGSLKSRYRFRCTIVGGGTLEGNVRQNIEDSGWEDIVVLGWKSGDEVRALLETADVFVLPSHAEGFPNALLEAMAKGLPAICSDTGGISDSLIDGVNGFLIPPRAGRRLAQAMERYLLDPELIGRHSQSTLRILRMNHDWESNCRKLFSIFG